MSRLTIDTGTEGNPATGDSLRGAFTKVNTNFAELYTELGTDGTLSDLKFTDNIISSEETNQNIVLSPNGTGQVEMNGAVKFNVGYVDDINTLTSSSTITVNCNLAPVHKVTLATNTAFVITNLPTGGTVTLIITQDATGLRTATFGTDTSTAVKFPSGAATLSTAANAIDVVTIFNDGSNFLGNIANSYS